MSMRLCVTRPVGGGGRVLPSNRLMGMYMCRLVGSHFHNWSDYRDYWVLYFQAFSKELLQWGRTFLGFWGKTIWRVEICKRED